MGRLRFPPWQRVAHGARVREIDRVSLGHGARVRQCRGGRNARTLEVRLEQDYEGPKYELPVDDINWTAGAGRTAGVYWLNGRSLIAAHGTVAELRLVEQGAVPVATLRFDPDPLERVQHGRVVHRMGAPDVRRIAAPAAPN